MRDTGNPLSIEVRKTFTEVAPPTCLAYLSLIDFVPGHEPSGPFLQGVAGVGFEPTKA